MPWFFGVNGIHVRAFNLSHGPYFIKDETSGLMINKHQDIQNLGFLFTIGEHQIYHSGDADVSSIEDLIRLELDKENISVAFLDCSILLYNDPRRSFEIISYLNPKYLIPMHMSGNEKMKVMKIA